MTEQWIPDSVVIDPRALSVTAVGQEFPVAYRLARRGGELVLQGLWRETVTEQSRTSPNDLRAWNHYQRDEWRDISTVGESSDAGG